MGSVEVYKAGLFVFLLTFLHYSMPAQQFVGLGTGNYAGSGMASVNPSLLNNSRAYLGVGLISAGAFFENNYIYFSNSRPAILEAFQSQPDLDPYAPEDYPFWHYYGPGYNDISKSAFSHVRLSGPSFMLNGRKDALAFRMEHRSWLAIWNLPYHLAKFMYEGLDYVPQQNTQYLARDVRIVMAGALSAGLTYSRVLAARQQQMLSGGFTLYYLLPSFGSFISIDALDYMVPNDSLLLVDDFDATYGFALPMDYNDNSFRAGDGLRMGSGFSLDVGMTYYLLEKDIREADLMKRSCAVPFHDYRLRIGLSVMDAGKLHFQSNALLHTMEDRSTVWPGVDTVGFRNLNYFTNLLSRQFFPSSGRSLSGYDLSIYLPAVLSLQTDVRIRDGYYLNTHFMHPLKLGEPWIRHPVMIYLTPRYESQWLEAGLPVSLYDFSAARLGFYFRLAGLTVGVDDLNMLLAPRDFTGANFYAGLQLWIGRGRCEGTRSRGNVRPGRNPFSTRHKGWNRGVPCEAYY